MHYCIIYIRLCNGRAIASFSIFIGITIFLRIEYRLYIDIQIYIYINMSLNIIHSFSDKLNPK